MGRILAIDIGAKRCGIAETDFTETIASGLKTISPQEVLGFISNYIVENQLDVIVVGLPRNLDGSETDATQLALDFYNKIQKSFNKIQVELIDERLTSKIAKRTLFQAGLKKKRRQQKDLLDKVSATLILQTYLSRNKK